MKKKKLKKKIKELRKELRKGLETVMHDGKEAFDNQNNKISTLGDKYIKLREDFNRLNQKSNAGAFQFQINDIYEKLKILKLRTDTDYDKIIPKTEEIKNEKTCDTCDHLVLSGCGTQCVGCPANNKKEGDINGN